jgi:RNA polymerase sigma-70 factor (ECF subfamily)
MDNALAEQQLKLMQAVANGDRRAFEQLYRLTSPHLFAVALRMLRHRAWAEEILHDCFVTVWSKAETYNAALSSPMTWLTHIVRNRCIDWLRSGQTRAAAREESYSEESLLSENDEQNNWHDDAQAARLRHCLEHLSQRAAPEHYARLLSGHVPQRHCRLAPAARGLGKAGYAARWIIFGSAWAYE